MINSVLKIRITSLLLFSSLVFNAQVNSPFAVGSSSSSNNPKPSTNNQQPTTINHLRSGGMVFTPNKGQITDMEGNWRPDILYKGRTQEAAIYLRRTGISYVQTNISEVMFKIDGQLEELIQVGVLTETDKKTKQDQLLQKEKINIHRIDMDFAGANTHCQLVNEDELQGFNNYYYAHCPNGILNVKQYNKVTYKNIYKGIDVEYLGSTTTGLKYNLIVQPHAEPNQVKLNWKGAKEIKLAGSKLQVESSLGTMTETLPKVYQNINGKIVDVECKYKLEEVGSSKLEVRSKVSTHLLPTTSYLVTFELGTYNLELPLVIDPYAWATYYGGATSQVSYDIEVDAGGNSVITGETTSNPFPITAGAFQTTFGSAGFTDCFIVKFNPNGGRLWSTYLGGNNTDQTPRLTIDMTNNIIVVFNTKSTNFPVTFGPSFSGTWNNVLTKFNAGGGLIWAKYLGLPSVVDIASDSNGDIICAGIISSATISSISATTQQTTYGGGFADAFIIKFNSLGAVLWSTFCGGSLYDGSSSVNVDKKTNDIILTGLTLSTDMPLSATPFQGTLKGTADYFVVKYNTLGWRLWATYLGGSGSESTYRGTGLIDNQGNTVIVGHTPSLDFPVSLGAFQSTYGGGSMDFFVTKFNQNGSLLWSTYLGGNRDELFATGTVDTYNNIYVFGEWEDTDNGNFPMNTCALQKTFGGGPASHGGPEDWFVTKFNPSGKRSCSTFIGGNGIEELDYGGGGIATFGNYVFITGTNENAGFPVTPGAFQKLPQSSFTYARTPIVAKFCSNSCGENNPVNVDFAIPVGLCSNVPVQFNSTVNSVLTCDTVMYKWIFTDGTPSTSTQRNPAGITYALPGTYQVTLVVSATCGGDTLKKSITIDNCTVCTLTAQTTINKNISCNGSSDGSVTATVSNTNSAPYTFKWSTGATGISTSSMSVTSLVAGTYTVTITDNKGCTATSTATLISPTPLTGQFTKGTATCTNCGCQEWLLVNATGATPPYTYQWSAFGGYDKRYKNKICAGSYNVKVTDKNGCSVDVNVSTP